MAWNDTKIQDEGATAAGQLSATEYNDLVTNVENKIGASTTDTLINKTIDADNNTISNLAIGSEVSSTITSSISITVSDNSPVDISSDNGSFTRLIIDNTSTGDSQLNFQLSGVTAWSIGTDDSDSDSFKFSTAATLHAGTQATLDSSGNWTMTGNITGVGNFDYDTADGTVSSLGNLGATETIDWSTATHFTGTLDSNVTITHSNETTGRKITLLLAYDGTAQRTIVWSDVNKWAGGSAPAAPSSAGEVLLVTMLFVGTTCYASAELFS